MKKILACILALFSLTFVFSAFAEGDKPTYDFKKFLWGDSRNSIEAVEGEPFADGKVNGSSTTYIVYETTAVGLDTLLAYYFSNEGLCQIRYLLTEEHSNDNLYIDDYSTFRSALTKKYGEPTLDFISWNDDSMKSYYEKNGKSMGDAVSFGYCTYYTVYLTERTMITMEMSADNYDISTTIDYISNTVTQEESDFSDEI